MMNAPKTLDQKNLRKNRKIQRNLLGKDDTGSMKKLERLILEEKEILQMMEVDKCRKEKRLQKSREKALIKDMTFEETCEYFKSKDRDSIKVDHLIPNTREARIHRKKVIQGVQQYKMDQYFMEQFEMRRKLKAFLENIESED